LEQQKKVTTIPATLTRFSSSPIAEKKKRKVAGYARVSTDHDDQFTSYEAQIDYYTNYIKARDDWEFVKVYTDEGISGTGMKKRVGFRTMIDDALAGKIDLIVTKSVSRFARNTVDSLTTIRKLKEHGVECYFEKENIWTFDGKGELLITIMSSLAQEESRSISENCTWGQRKRFADGKVTVPFKRFLGYDRGPNGELIVNKEEAETVKRIYDLYLRGKTYNGIAKELTADGIKTPGGKDKWCISTIRSILSNEKYKGDALLQKSYTIDYLTKKSKVNEGEIPQYYVEGDHEAIIPPEKFDLVQREMERRGKGGKYHSGIHPFSSKIKCGQCGSFYGSKVWHSTDKYRRTIWRCNHKYDVGKKCTTPAIDDSEVKTAFLSAVNKLLETKAEVIANGKEMLPLLFKTDELESERDRLMDEAQVVADAVQQNIAENARTALDQSAYQKRYDDLANRYDKLKTRIDELTTKIEETQSRKAGYEDFLKAFQNTPDSLTEFSLDAFNGLVDHLTVYSKDDIRFTFRNGQEIKA
jgi:DNA invertase Pin-like site-specific DNA recombinase